MWQKIKDFFKSESIKEEHKKNMQEIEMQHKKIMQELIELIKDMNETEILVVNELKAHRENNKK